ncbi:MAG TPA: hypothetical protein VFR37_05065, partial [Longimicrobium sp.]|nr:hypothetical protein [Longimicrobium sp.]
MPADDWPFDQAPDVAAITTRQVLSGGLPVLRVAHYSEDHGWAFVCGTTDATEDGRVIAMREALELDPTLRTIADLPPGWTAWREQVGAPWYRAPDEQAEPAVAAAAERRSVRQLRRRAVLQGSEHGVSHGQPAAGV